MLEEGEFEFQLSASFFAGGVARLCDRARDLSYKRVQSQSQFLGLGGTAGTGASRIE